VYNIGEEFGEPVSVRASCFGLDRCATAVP
jgi:hypothetical protein